jgi:heme/copper-type cytochrome/quinol oxidase subunit 2
LNIRKIVSARIAALVLVAIWTSAVGAQTAAQPRVIEVIADKDNRFKVPGESKPVITLKAGEKVVLRITSHFGGEKARDDAVHSFTVKALNDPKWDIRLYEGTKDYKLVAPARAGEYEIECTVKCGPGHDDMKAKLIVQ